MAAFVELFRGFLLKESVTQAETLEHVDGLRLTGGLLWNSLEGCYQGFSETNPVELVSKPHLIGLSRNLTSRSLGSWAGSMFLYQPPQFGFSRSEQRLLLAALRNLTDQELSTELVLSPFTVKKMWRSIYERVAQCSPELIPANSSADGASERGREKKQRLIAYLRDRPEELRPIARKLVLRNGTPEGKAVP